MYPGTSVLHTRAKYYILIPALFKKALKSGLTTGSEVRRLIDSDQDEIARTLRRAIDEETGTKATGIIGGRSDRAVKMKPARIYWNALRTTGILCNPTLSYDDACSAVAGYNRKNQNINLKEETDDDGGDALDAGNGSFILFTAPCKQSIDNFLQNATLHLTKDEAVYLRDQFVHMPIMKNTLMEYCLRTNTSFAGMDLSEIKPAANMSEELKYHLELAVEFSDFIYGAYTVYNLLFWENGGEYATDDVRIKLEERYKVWRKTNKGLSHRDEILSLVNGHEYYKGALREFLINFEAAVNANDSDVCSEEERKLVKARERTCKREKAKIGRDYPFGEIHSTPMNYRHDTGQTIISDILKGMMKDNG